VAGDRKSHLARGETPEALSRCGRLFQPAPWASFKPTMPTAISPEDTSRRAPPEAP